jgi:exonuclease III
MADKNDKVRVVTYNMHGLNIGLPLLNTLFENYDIICIQEVWVRPNELNRVRCLHIDFDCCVVSSMNNEWHNEVIMGRPYGGLAIFWRKSLIHNVLLMGHDVNTKCIGISFETNVGRVFVWNVYLPCGSSVSNDDYEIILMEIFSYIESQFELHSEDGVEQASIICGDFNVTMDKIYCVQRYNVLKHFLSDWDMICGDAFDNTSIGYTYFHDGLNVSSYIDHFFISNNIINTVNSVKILDFDCNLSDHLPVECVLNLFVKNVQSTNTGKCYDCGSKLTWDEQSRFNYCYAVTERLNKEVLLSCTCIGKCDSLDHRQNIDIFHDMICNVINECSMVCNTACARIHKNKGVLWNNELNDLKKKSLNAHKLWVQCNRPRTGAINLERVQTKCEYKRAIKHVKMSWDRRRKEILSVKLAAKDSKGFWKAWKQLDNVKHDDRNVIIEGLNDDKEICEGFGQHFVKCFKDSTENKTLQAEFVQMHTKYMANWNDGDIVSFSFTDVEKCIGMLKVGKAVGIDNISAEHVKYGGDLLWRFLVTLFNECIRHGYVPHTFCEGIICPIQKKVNACKKFDDYRPITLVTIFSKLFEMCLYDMFKNHYAIHELQFGFVPNGGCEKAVFVVRSVCEYFLEHGSSIYLASLDISKAYDSINHYSLFIKLMNIKLPRSIIELLIYWYSELNCIVKWCFVMSSKFLVKSGVRQGGPWSPWLFNVVINDLICKLEANGMGCWIRGLFAGGVLYADDVMLMSASICKLQCMLNICCEFGKENGLAFNAKKSLCMMFGKRLSNSPLPMMFIDGMEIKWCDECTYLGIKLCSNKSFKCSADERKRKFCAAVNSVISKSSNMSEEVIVHVIKMQCLPILTYGCCAWKISNNDTQKLCVCFNNAFRKVFRYKLYESVKCLLYFFNLLPLDMYFAYKKLCFVDDCTMSCKSLVRMCGLLWYEGGECQGLAKKYNLKSVNSMYVYDDFWKYVYNEYVV